jgi:hypothetical protein
MSCRHQCWTTEKHVLGVIDLTDLLTFLVDEIGPTSNANAAVPPSPTCAVATPHR